jgi:hypothetical protein
MGRQIEQIDECITFNSFYLGKRCEQQDKHT